MQINDDVSLKRLRNDDYVMNDYVIIVMYLFDLRDGHIGALFVEIKFACTCTLY